MMAAQWDYVIVGAGSAGCVLADRLSADPRHRVLLLEAGPADRHPFIHMPRGVAKLYGDPGHIWYFQTQAHGEVPSETWLRGKVLGGSSSINGMMYFRGQPSDYDGWEAVGARGWGWSAMASAFRAMEGHELGGSAVRGGEGPLRISVDRDKNPLHEAYIAAGLEMGLPRVSDLNDLGPDGQGVGYATRTISRGRRQSSAQAFLRRARTRPNLHVMTGATVERIVFEGKRAAAVEAVVAGARQRIDCAGEIILSAGALMSPQILERSGIGQATRLRPFGIEPIHDSRGVGEHMFEHRLLMTQYEVDSPHTDNHELRGLRLVKNAARYFLGGGGKMSAGYGTVAAFAKVLPESPTADIEIIYTPLVVMPDAQGRLRPDQVPSIQIFGYPLRSRSEGHIHISGPGLAAPADLRANYLTDAYDQRVTIAMFRYIREWMEQGALASIAPRERELTASLHTDEEILAAFRSNGQAGYHACGTCRMGAFADAVVDERCRVKGVAGLRVIDASIMPSMVSANTNGPVMAMAWRAADLIAEDRR